MNLVNSDSGRQLMPSLGKGSVQPNTAKTGDKVERIGCAVEASGYTPIRAGEKYFLAARDGSVVNFGSQGARDGVRHAYYEKHRGKLNESDLEFWESVTRARLQKEPESIVARRVAKREDKFYLDLADGVNVVEMSAEGWKLVEPPPGIYFFRNGRREEALSEPVRAGDVTLIKNHSRLCDADLKLAIGWMLGSLRCDIPAPWLLCEGASGSGKTTEARILRSFIDPDEWESMVSTFPNDIDGVMAHSASSHVLAYDNLEKISDKRSDLVCQMVTGASSIKRALYTNNDAYVVKLKNPGILTGLGGVATKADLADRLIVFHFEGISTEQKQKEHDIRSRLSEDAPRILGGLLDAFCAGLKGEHSVIYDKSARMMDFSAFVTAAEEALPWSQGEICRALNANRAESFSDLASGDTTLASLLQYLEGSGMWEGTPKDLLAALTKITPTDSLHYLPTSPRNMVKKISEFSPILSAHGFKAERASRTKNGRKWKISRANPKEFDSPEAIEPPF